MLVTGLWSGLFPLRELQGNFPAGLGSSGPALGYPRDLLGHIVDVSFSNAFRTCFFRAWVPQMKIWVPKMELQIK